MTLFEAVCATLGYEGREVLSGRINAREATVVSRDRDNILASITHREVKVAGDLTRVKSAD